MRGRKRKFLIYFCCYFWILLCAFELTCSFNYLESFFFFLAAAVRLFCFFFFSPSPPLSPPPPHTQAYIMDPSADIARLHKYNIGSILRTPEEAFLPHSLNESLRVVNPKYTTSWEDLFQILTHGICTFQNTIPDGPSCRGWGVDWYAAQDLILPSLRCFFFFLVLRYLLRRPMVTMGYYTLGIGSDLPPMDPHTPPLYHPVTKKLSISPRRYCRLIKFQNQLWLTLFYVASSLFGYLVQYDKPWFTFPVTPVSAVYFHAPSPYHPTRAILFYYSYGLGFYLSEMFSLLFDHGIRRSDFLEYFLHHVVTLLLIFFSHAGWMHRFGAYVLFLHDSSDILLSFSKSLHYVVEAEENRVKRSLRVGEGGSGRKKKGSSPSSTLSSSMTTRTTTRKGNHHPSPPYHSPWCFRYLFTTTAVNISTVGFVVFFFFFRLFCLPKMMLATFWLGFKLFYGNVNVWCMTTLLNLGLQTLHIYWGWLITVMAIKILRGGKRKDIRSGDDETDDEEEKGKEKDDPAVDTFPSIAVAHASLSSRPASHNKRSSSPVGDDLSLSSSRPPSSPHRNSKRNENGKKKKKDKKDLSGSLGSTARKQG